MARKYLRMSAAIIPLSATAGEGRREETEIFPRHRRARERGDVGDVVGRGDLDDVHPDEGERTEPAKNGLRLPRGEAADFGRAGSRREGGIESVDVEGQIDRPCADRLADEPRNIVGRRGMRFLGRTIVTPLPTVQS